jgi:hypothetical protein
VMPIMETEVLFFLGATSPCGPGPPHYWGFTLTIRHTTLGRIPPHERSVWPKNIYLTTYDNHDRQISMPRRIRFRNSIVRAATDPRLRPRGHWDRLETEVLRGKFIPLALFSPQFTHWLARQRTCVSEVRGRPVTTTV